MPVELPAQDRRHQCQLSCQMRRFLEDPSSLHQSQERRCQMPNSILEDRSNPPLQMRRFFLKDQSTAASPATSPAAASPKINHLRRQHIIPFYHQHKLKFIEPSSESTSAANMFPQLMFQNQQPQTMLPHLYAFNSYNPS
ncbi:hypothetical protein TNCT_259861 [Trichonephila clavata]|uniref:Uncharacterized protein n=1 Tax=Trichonephila clavata TaxID=2740835 RepID=A0A8X6L442_TRICU|nr:hypothetical protein TNCT_259861 [Trichonephila clavata]